MPGPSTTENRLDQSIEYLRVHVSSALADQLRLLVKGHEAEVHNDLHLGTRWDVFASKSVKEEHTKQRHALRALLLCQRVFWSNLWPIWTGETSTLKAPQDLPAGWKDSTCRLWAPRSELEIRNGLRTYVVTQDSAPLVAAAAARWKPSQPRTDGYLATRETYQGSGVINTCYQAVMYWLFKSGLVSLGWYRRYLGANTREGLEAAFGGGRLVWQGALAKDRDFPWVPKGHVVHLYDDERQWRGHWVVSLGGGKAAGVNNNDEFDEIIEKGKACKNPVKGFAKMYCTTLSLKRQFGDDGIAIAFDPKSIPNR